MFKIKKFFRPLCIILILTISLSVCFKPKKTDAFAISGSLALLGLGILTLCGIGVVASDSDMLEDIGTTIWDGVSGFFDLTESAGNVVAKVKSDITWSVITGAISNKFSEPKNIVKNITFPYEFELQYGQQYGTFTTSKLTRINILDSSLNIVATNDFDLPFKANIDYKIFCADFWVDGISNILVTNTYYPSQHPTVNETGSINYPAGNSIGRTFTIEAKDWITSLPINEELSGTTTVTIPYDGTNVKAKEDTFTSLPVDTTLSTPKVETFPTDLPKTDINIKDLPIDVTKPVTGDITQEGFWDWVMDIPGSISNWWDSTFTDVPSLDFAPLQVATDKFPFCIPWDFLDMIDSLKANKKPPVFIIPDITLPVANFVVPGFTIDISDIKGIDILITILRYFELLAFVVFLALATRSIFLRG